MSETATLVLNVEDYEYMLAILLARATEDKYHTNYDIVALVEKIKNNKQYNSRRDRARGY